MTDPDDLVLDGNALAGVLASVFGGAEMTSAARGCGSCGQRHALAEHRLYRGAGLGPALPRLRRRRADRRGGRGPRRARGALRGPLVGGGLRARPHHSTSSSVSRS